MDSLCEKSQGKQNTTYQIPMSHLALTVKYKKQIVASFSEKVRIAIFANEEILSFRKIMYLLTTSTIRGG